MENIRFVWTNGAVGRLLVRRDSLWYIFLVPRVERCVKCNERFTNISLVVFNVARNVHT